MEKENVVAADDKLREAVLKASRDGRIPCAAARKLARDLQVSPREIGEACDRLKIKIKECELGCF